MFVCVLTLLHLPYVPRCMDTPVACSVGNRGTCSPTPSLPSAVVELLLCFGRALNAASDRHCRHGADAAYQSKLVADKCISPLDTSLAAQHNPARQHYYTLIYLSPPLIIRSHRCHLLKRGPSFMAHLSTRSRFRLSRLCRGVCLPSLLLDKLTGSKRTSTNLLSWTSLLSMDHSTYPS
jgi:hypothetical protein